MSLRIVVTVKYVPDATGDRHFADDLTVDRDDVDGLLGARRMRWRVALQIADEADDAEITVLTVGPEDAKDALRKALSMGADKAIHVEDDDLHGTDAIQTSPALAKAIEKAGYDLVISGMASTDGTAGIVPALLAERLGVPAGHPALRGSSSRTASSRAAVTVRTARPSSWRLLPAVVVSVTDQSGEARYPSFRSIMAAKKKPVESWGPGGPGDRGRGRSRGRLDQGRLRDRAPGATAGTIVKDEGEGGKQLAEFLAAEEVHLKARSRLAEPPLADRPSSFVTGEKKSHG